MWCFSGKFRRHTERLFSVISKRVYGRLFAMDIRGKDILGKCMTHRSRKYTHRVFVCSDLTTLRDTKSSGRWGFQSCLPSFPGLLLQLLTVMMNVLQNTCMHLSPLTSHCVLNSLVSPPLRCCHRAWTSSTAEQGHRCGRQRALRYSDNSERLTPNTPRLPKTSDRRASGCNRRGMKGIQETKALF